ncbi:MAG: VWA domain-containing protein [Planctomycetota bacterium]
MSEWIPIEFGRPWWLLGLVVALVLTVVIARNSLAGQSRVRARMSLGLRVLVVVLLGLILADLRLTLRGKGLTVLFLLDLSESVPRAASDDLLNALVAMARERPADQRVGLIVFGRDASVEREPSSQLGQPHVQSVIDRDGTDIAAALRLAHATFVSSAGDGPGRARRIVLISDGNANRGDALLEARNLATADTVIDVLPLDYRYDEEVMVDSLIAPTEAHHDEPYRVTAIVDSLVATQGKILLYENGQLVETREIEIPIGKSRVDFQRTNTDESRYTYEVRLFPERDTVAKNNVGYGATLIGGRARVLMICGTSRALLVDALQSAGLYVEIVAPDEIPGRAEDYFLYDAIVLVDVPAFHLGNDRMRLLHGVVKNLGVGFVGVGGPDAFGAGGYRDTPIEQLLPVEMDVRNRKSIPNGALAMVLHTCEFPQGNMWAKRIARIAVDALTPDDYVGVLVWTGMGSDLWGVPFGLATDKAAIGNRIASLQPNDMPDFSPSMRLGLAALQTAPAVQKHMLIISDGDPAAPSAQTIQAFIDSRISVSCVCINPHTGQDTGQMKRIAQDTGGRYYRVEGPAELPQIFAREALQVRRNLITEETFVPRIAASHPVLMGVAEEGLPPLHGYVITTSKALAETVLVSHQDDPILSTWRYGLAKTAAFTSDATGRWARDWIGWPGFGTFWAQLVRSVSKRGAGDLFRVQRSIEGERGRITLDAIDPDGRFVDGLGFEGRVLDPQFDEQEVTFQQTGPGRYEADFLATRAGSYLLSATYRGPDQLMGSLHAAVNVSYSPEFRELKASPDKLLALAEVTGGRVLGPSDDPFDTKTLNARSERRPLWESLVPYALLFFFLDIVLRRVMWSLAPLRKLVATLTGRASRAPVSRSETLGALLVKREEVRTSQPVARKLELPAEPKARVKAASPSPPAEPSPPEPTPPEPPAKEKSANESFTDRLLRAKRAAQDERDRRGT